MSGLLEHLTVVEIGGPLTEWCGRLFSQAGARVILVEPPAGAPSRQFAPFLDGKEGDPEASLHFWHYNTDKESVVLDLETSEGKAALSSLLAHADVLIEGDGASVAAEDVNSELVHVVVTPFGDEGPWAGLVANDAVHLALGGQMMVCGYDDIQNTPPLAPTGNQAYHMAGTWAFIAALARLHARTNHGGGRVGISVHEACAGMTENALPNYDYTGQVVSRRTGRHASVAPTPAWQYRSGDGRYVNAQLVNVPPNAWIALVEWMEAAGMAEDLTDPKYFIPELFREHSWRISEVLSKFIASMPADEFFHGAQARGLIVSDINYPQDLVADEHLAARMFWRDIDTEDGSKRTFSGSTFLCADSETGPWRRPPHFGEHTAALQKEFGIA